MPCPWRPAGTPANFVPAFRQLAFLHQLELLGLLWKLRLVISPQLHPLRVRIAAALADAIVEMLVHAIRDQEFCVIRPFVILFH